MIKTYTARPAAFVELDNRRAEALVEGSGSSIAFPAPCGRFAVDCSVTVTGREVQRRAGSLWARVRVLWLGEEDESKGCGGWLMVDARSAA